MRKPASHFCFIFQFGLNLFLRAGSIQCINAKCEDRFPFLVKQYFIDFVDDKDNCVSWGTSVEIDCYFVSVSKMNRKYRLYKSFFKRFLTSFPPRPQLKTMKKQNQRFHFIFWTPSQQNIVGRNTV